MSDLRYPILFVVNDEAESFWCSVALMERLGPNFNRDQNGMHTQLFAISKFSLSLQSPPHVEDISSGYMMLPRPMSHVLGKIQSQTCWATLLWKLHTLVKGMSKGSVNWKTIAKIVYGAIPFHVEAQSLYEQKNFLKTAKGSHAIPLNE